MEKTHATAKKEVLSATIRPVLLDLLNRLTDLDQKVNYLIETIHDFLSRHGGPGFGGENE